VRLAALTAGELWAKVAPMASRIAVQVLDTAPGPRFAATGVPALAAALWLAVPLAGAPQPAPRTLAFERGGAIWVAAADGSGAVKLVEGVDPCIAPDGRRIAYTKDTSQANGVRRHIAVVDVGTRTSRVLASVPSDNAFGPVWSPDGTRLLVNVLANGGWNLGLVNVDDTSFGYICKTGPAGRTCWSAAWAPDGNSVFCQDLESLSRISLEGKELWKASFAKLFPTGGLNSGARISPSPDGRTLLVDVDMDEETTIQDWDGPPPAVFLVDLSAKTSRRLSPKGLFAWEPQWLDAVNFLCIVQRQEDKEPSVVRMPLSGGPPTVLVRNARTPTVSPTP